MGEKWYLAYQREIGRKNPMLPSGRDVNGIGDKTAASGEVTMEIPSPELDVVIDVDVSVLPGETPHLLSNKDML